MILHIFPIKNLEPESAGITSRVALLRAINLVYGNPYHILLSFQQYSLLPELSNLVRTNKEERTTSIKHASRY